MKKLYLLLLTLMVSVVGYAAFTATNPSSYRLLFKGELETKGNWKHLYTKYDAATNSYSAEFTPADQGILNFGVDEYDPTVYSYDQVDDNHRTVWHGGGMNIIGPGEYDFNSAGGNSQINALNHTKKYRITLFANTSKVMVEEIGEAYAGSFYAIKGSFNDGNWYVKDMYQQEDGTWIMQFTASTSKNVDFGVHISNKRDNSTQDGWWNGATLALTGIPASTGNYQVSVTKDKKYRFTLNPTAKTLKFEEVVDTPVTPPVVEDTYSYSLSGKIFSKDATADESKDFIEKDGVYTLSNVRIFPGTFNVLEKKNSDAATKLTSSATVSTTNLEVDLTAGDAAITSELNGTYTVTYTKATGKLKFEGTEYVPVYTHTLKGTIFSENGTESAQAWTLEGDVYTASNVRIRPGSFNVFESLDGGTPYKLTTTSEINTTTKTAELTTGDAAINSKLDGTYTITYNKESKQLSFTGNETMYTYSLSGKIFSRDASAVVSQNFTGDGDILTLSNLALYPGDFNVVLTEDGVVTKKFGGNNIKIKTDALCTTLAENGNDCQLKLEGTYTVTFNKATKELKFEGTQVDFCYRISGDLADFTAWKSGKDMSWVAGDTWKCEIPASTEARTLKFKVRTTNPDDWYGPVQIDKYYGLSKVAGDYEDDFNYAATLEANTAYVIIVDANPKAKAVALKTKDVVDNTAWYINTPIFSADGNTWTDYIMQYNSEKNQWTYAFPEGSPSHDFILKVKGGYSVTDYVHGKADFTLNAGITPCAGENQNMNLDLKNATSEYTLVLDIAADDKYTLSLNEKTNTYSYTFSGFGNGTFVEKDGVYTLEKVRLAPGSFTVKEQKNSDEPYNICSATTVSTAAKTVKLAKVEANGVTTSTLNGIYTVTFNPASKELSFDGPFCGDSPTWYFYSDNMTADKSWADYEMTPNADKSQWTYAFPKGTAAGAFILRLKDADYVYEYIHSDFTMNAGIYKDDASTRNMWVALNNATSDYTLVLDIPAEGKKTLTLNEVKAPEVYVPTFTYTLVDLTGNTFNPDDVKLTPTLGEFNAEGKIENLDLMPGSIKLVVKKDGEAYKSFYCTTDIAAQGDAVFDTEIDAYQSATVAIDGRYTVTLTPTIANNEVTSVSLNFAGTDRTWPELYLRGSNYGSWTDATQNPKFARTRNIYTLELPNGLKGEGKIADAKWGWGFATDEATIAENKDYLVYYKDGVNINFPVINIHTTLTLTVGRGSTLVGAKKENGNLRITSNEHAVSVSGVPMTFYFEKPATWGAMSCYAWNEVNGAKIPLKTWPGYPVETTETTINGKQYHEVTIPGTAEWVIFNDIADEKRQTVDLKAVSGGVYDIIRDGVELGLNEGGKRKCYDPFVTYEESVAATITPAAGGSNEDVATVGSSIFYNTSFAGTEFSITVNVGAGKICLYKAVPLTMTQYKADIDAVMNPRKAAAKNFQEQDVSTFTAVATDDNGTATVKVPLNVENQGRLYIATRDNTTGLYSEPTEYWYNAYGDGGIATGVESLEAAEEVQYFNLQGAPVQNPQGGIFIRVSGGKATKLAL